MYYINIVSRPMISIVTVVLNGVRTIEDTIRSVINQTYPNIEYIIIDGGSTDGTLEVVAKYKKYIKVVISELDSGISNAFNKGILVAKGEIIGLINSDDWLEKTAVDEVVNAYVKFPYYDIYYGNCFLIKTNGDVTTYVPENGHLSLFEKMSISHPSTFVKRTAYLKYGLFNEEYRIAMDYEWLLKSYIDGALFMHIDKILANHRDGGISQVNYKEGYAECLMARKIYLGR